MNHTIARSCRSHLPVAAFLLFPLVGFYWRILWGGELICGGDLINQFIPWREFALNELQAGRFPFWNPLVFCGTPFASNIQTSLFYPFTLLNMLFSVETTFSLSLVFHHALSLMTMYLFLFRVFGSKAGAAVGATIYGWSGFFITHAHDGHLIHLRAYALIPLALYFQTLLKEKITFKRIFGLAAVLSGLFFAGHTQIPLYIFYILLFRSIWWGYNTFRHQRRLSALMVLPGWTAFALVFSLGLSALVLLPLLELSQHTAGRAGGTEYTFATSDSLPPQHLLTLLAPFFYGDPTAKNLDEKFWETGTGFHEICGYTGILSFILLFLAFLPDKSRDEASRAAQRTEVLFFAALAAAGLFFALGHFNPLYPILHYGLPGWNYFRVPGRLVLLFIIGISVCSAKGMANWMQKQTKDVLQTKALKTAVVFSALLFVMLVILAVSKSSLLAMLREIEVNRTIEMFGHRAVDPLQINLRLPQSLFETRYLAMLHSTAIACAILLAGWISLYLLTHLQRPSRWSLIALIILGDLLFFSHRFIETKPAPEWKQTFFPQTELVTFLQTHSDGGRVLCLDDAIGNPGIESHPELRPNRLMHYGIETVRGYDPIILKSYVHTINELYKLPQNTPQGGLLFFPSLPPDPSGLSAFNIRLIVTTQPLPEPFRIVWIKETSPVKVYQNPFFTPRFSWKETQQSEGINVLASHPTFIHLEIEDAPHSSLSISRNFFPGWRVRTSNEPEKPIEHTFPTLPVQPNQRQALQMHYHPRIFIYGGLVSMLTLLCGIGGLAIEARARALCEKKPSGNMPQT
jgi:hypothetical protein